MTETQSVKELTGGAEGNGTVKAFAEKYPNGPKSCDRRSDKDFQPRKWRNFGLRIPSRTLLSCRRRSSSGLKAMEALSILRQFTTTLGEAHMMLAVLCAGPK